MRRAGFILTGGKSSRMGRDKAMIPFGSQTLVEKIAHQVLLAAGSCTLVGSQRKYGSLGLPILDKERLHEGPLAGIEAILQFSAAERNLILACDLPTITQDLLQFLFHRSEESNAPCVVVRDARNQLHPLCGVYQANCLPEITAALNAEQRKITDVIAKLHPEIADWPEILSNINTPGEWEAFVAHDATVKSGA